MPIYEYRCSKCGFQEEYLQKVSEPPMSVCPTCGKASFVKLLSAAGFQLKGSGWYATDFKSGAKGAQQAAAKTAETKPEGKTEATSEARSDAKSDAKTGSKSDAARAGGQGACPVAS